MKGQDILLLLKIHSISCQIQSMNNEEAMYAPKNHDWVDWEDLLDTADMDLEIDQFSFEKLFSLRDLEKATGISKSQISLSMRRCEDIGLLKSDRKTLLPKVNTQGLSEFVYYGLKYVFPAKPGEITRGIATGISSPILEGKLFSSGETPWVWPYGMGKTKGQSILPIYKTVPFAVKKDPMLYALLALVDSIRIGNNRERKFAFEVFQSIMKREGKEVYE